MSADNAEFEFNSKEVFVFCSSMVFAVLVNQSFSEQASDGPVIGFRVC